VPLILLFLMVADTAKQLRVATTPFLIMVSPVTLILSIFTLIHFGFYVALNSLSPVWLQKPVAAGGYGFSVEQNAICEQNLYFPRSFLETTNKSQSHLLIGLELQSHSSTATSYLTGSLSKSAPATTESGGQSTASMRFGSRD
jgi:hypothetical protein